MKKYTQLLVLIFLLVCYMATACMDNYDQPSYPAFNDSEIDTIPTPPNETEEPKFTREETTKQTKKPNETKAPTSPKNEYARLKVINIMQKPHLPNGCEVVSLAIALNYAGYNIDPLILYDKYMPKSPYKNGDPWTTYVGDAKGVGYGCYAPCIVATGNAFFASLGSPKKVVDVSGESLEFYEKMIDQGTPVILWGLIEMNGNPSVCWRSTVKGKKVEWHSFSHCMVLIGYTSKTYIFCDPLKGITEYRKSDVELSFSINYRQACIVK